jgi:histidyl-tRNA synthetase
MGFGLGVDRTLLACRAEGLDVVAQPLVEVYVVPLGAACTAAVLPVVAALRRNGVSCDVSWGGRGLRGALRTADALGARCAVIVGERDLADDSATVRDLRSGAQQHVALAEAARAVGDIVAAGRVSAPAAASERHARPRADSAKDSTQTQPGGPT